MTTQLARRQLNLPGGRTVAYREWGRPDGPVVILLHGLTSSADSWRLVGPLLGERYRVIGLDARGHGESDWASDYSFEAQTEDVREAMDALGVIGAAVIGHSMGGLTAFLLAVSHPDRVRALVLVDAPAPVPAYPTRPVRSGPLPGDAFDWRADVAVASWRNHPPEEWWGWATGILGQTLVLGGARSHLPQDAQQRWAADMPRGRYQEFGATHGMHEERPGAFAALVLPFLAEAIR